jgi:hypothetical protein
MRRLSLLAGTMTFLAASVCVAASGTTATGSGSAAAGSSSMGPYPAESALQVQIRLDRTKDFHLKYLQSKKDEALFREKEAAFRKKQAAYRAQCRDDLRRANRDAYFVTLLRCYKGDLGLERDELSKQRDALATMAGLSPAVRINARNRLDLLTDAMDTVVLAIDSEVYESPDDLLEARQNLLQKYRKPWWDAIAAVRADQTLTWTQYLITQIDAARGAEKAAGTDRIDWAASRACSRCARRRRRSPRPWATSVRHSTAA